MASEAKDAGTMADDATVGTIAWATVNNAKVSDNTYATATMPLLALSHYLKGTNFGFAIPVGATIDGIQLDVERSIIAGAGPPVRDNSVRIVKAGTFQGDEKAAGGDWPAGDTVISYGGAADLWGLTWTVANINASNFGAGLSAKALGSGVGFGIGRVDQLGQITVFFTPAADMKDQAGNSQII